MELPRHTLPLLVTIAALSAPGCGDDTKEWDKFFNCAPENLGQNLNPENERLINEARALIDQVLSESGDYYGSNSEAFCETVRQRQQELVETILQMAWQRDNCQEPREHFPEPSDAVQLTDNFTPEGRPEVEGMACAARVVELDRKDYGNPTRVQCEYRDGREGITIYVEAVNDPADVVDYFGVTATKMTPRDGITFTTGLLSPPELWGASVDGGNTTFSDDIIVCADSSDEGYTQSVKTDVATMHAFARELLNRSE